MARKTQTRATRVSVGDRYPQTAADRDHRRDASRSPTSPATELIPQFRRLRRPPDRQPAPAIGDRPYRRDSAQQALAKSSSSIPPQPNRANVRTTCPFPSSAIPRRRSTIGSASRPPPRQHSIARTPGGPFRSVGAALTRQCRRAPARPAAARAPTNGNLGLPADMLISRDGRLAGVRKYGVHVRSWSVDELLDLATSFSRAADPRITFGGWLIAKVVAAVTGNESPMHRPNLGRAGWQSLM